MLIKLFTILECSRVFSLPMTVLSWLVIFTISIIDSGNVWYGILALAAICFVHLGTNILDDYFDYKSLIKQVNFDKSEYLENTQKTKCRYLLSGIMNETQVLETAAIYFLIGLIIGIFFYIKCGQPVFYFALLGGIIAILYSFFSKIRLSELCVAIAYGPLLFVGTYFVMTKVLSFNALILSLPTMFMTVVILYIHTVMDYDFDLKEGHKTIANSFNSQLEALIVLKYLLIAAYITPILMCILDICDWQVLLTYLTIPLSIDLYKSMLDYSVDSESIPKKKWYHFPMENMEKIHKTNSENFMIRMYQARNLMIYFSLLLTIGIILSGL